MSHTTTVRSMAVSCPLCDDCTLCDDGTQAQEKEVLKMHLEGYPLSCEKDLHTHIHTHTPAGFLPGSDRPREDL